ncbi:MAG: hypothetical protein IJU92_02080 [Spirochaetaceae bacterium]|nr:hypothetical protein [Spirochaetaceae bacterium]
MKKNLLKIFAVMIAFSLAFVSCGKKETAAPAKDPVKVEDVNVDLSVFGEASDDEHINVSRRVYLEQLGEFYDYYQRALQQHNVSTRHALMAMAEAKLMASAVMVPTTTRGGNYAMTRFAPRSVSSVLWGSDNDRLHNYIVTNEIIKATDVAALKSEWSKRIGTGTYDDYAIDYLKKQGYTLSNTFSIGYTSDVTQWDTLASSRVADAEVVVNTFDGLYEYDNENVHQPALATGYTVSDDGLTYTFTIRQGVKWVDYQGREIAEVTADDFVAGMQHMLDAHGGLEFLVDGVIKGAHDYINGITTDFNQVGVKATDKYTLVYELENPTAYFMSMLGYNCFAPLCRSYFLSRGGAFGVDAYAQAINQDSYSYALGPDSIAYCGPYLITNYTREATYVFEKNPSYWNAKNVRIDKFAFLYNDGTDVLKAYNDMKAGVLTSAGLNSSAVIQAKTDGLFDTYAYTSDTDATSYMCFWNVNRVAYQNEDGAMASPMTEKQRTDTALAMTNQNFRLALSMAFDRASYNAQSVGDDLKLVSLRNCYTPGSFVTLTESVTVDMNGKEVTYPAGTFYGKIMQDQLNADGVLLKVWDEATASSDGYDGWYNVANAKTFLAKAEQELAAKGLTFSASNPIYIDWPYQDNSEISINMANSLKKSIEGAFEGKVLVNIVGGDRKQYLDTTYYFETGDTANYTGNPGSGWGPDYGDPQTYLDTFLPEGNGYMIKSIGIY